MNTLLLLNGGTSTSRAVFYSFIDRPVDGMKTFLCDLNVRVTWMTRKWVGHCDVDWRRRENDFCGKLFRLTRDSFPCLEVALGVAGYLRGRCRCISRAGCTPQRHRISGFLFDLLKEICLRWCDSGGGARGGGGGGRPEIALVCGGPVHLCRWLGGRRWSVTGGGVGHLFLDDLVQRVAWNAGHFCWASAHILWDGSQRSQDAALWRKSYLHARWQGTCTRRAHRTRHCNNPRLCGRWLLP